MAPRAFRAALWRRPPIDNGAVSGLLAEASRKRALTQPRSWRPARFGRALTLSLSNFPLPLQDWTSEFFTHDSQRSGSSFHSLGSYENPGARSEAVIVSLKELVTPIRQWFVMIPIVLGPPQQRLTLWLCLPPSFSTHTRGAGAYRRRWVRAAATADRCSACNGRGGGRRADGQSERAPPGLCPLSARLPPRHPAAPDAMLEFLFALNDENSAVY